MYMYSDIERVADKGTLLMWGVCGDTRVAQNGKRVEVATIGVLTTSWDTEPFARF